MYWPLGVLSSYSLPSPASSSVLSENDGDLGTETRFGPILSMALSAVGNLLVTVTSREIYVWESKVSSLTSKRAYTLVQSQWRSLPHSFAHRRPSTNMVKPLKSIYNWEKTEHPK